jgi:hypothetical protein
MKASMMKGLLVLALLLAVASAEAQKAPPPTPLGPAVLVHSTGKQIGPIVFNTAQSAPLETSVLLNINGLWVILFVHRSGFLNSQTRLLYTTNNCTGTAYFGMGDTNSLITQPEISGGILYFGDPSALQPLTYNSFELIDASWAV